MHARPVSVARLLARLESIMRIKGKLSTRPATAVRLHKMVGYARWEPMGLAKRFFPEDGNHGLKACSHHVIGPRQSKG